MGKARLGLVGPEDVDPGHGVRGGWHLGRGNLADLLSVLQDQAELAPKALLLLIREREPGQQGHVFDVDVDRHQPKSMPLKSGPMTTVWTAPRVWALS